MDRKLKVMTTQLDSEGGKEGRDEDVLYFLTP